jgi:polysaccharide export outer membrane protein
MSRWARPIAVLAAVSIVASCNVLPRVGPNKREIFAGSVQRQGDAFIVSVNDRVTRATSVIPALGFSQSFINAPTLGSDTIRPGDTVGLSIWENVDDGLLASEGANATVLEEVQVDGAGFIFVPYAGRIRAAGNTPEALRRIITNRLEEQTPDPQVQVTRVAGNGATVSLTGATGQGVYAIERPTRTLSTMLASAGGVTIEPEIARVTVIRGQERGTIWFQDLYKHPELDIALRAGDKILVEGDTRKFTKQGVSFSPGATRALFPSSGEDAAPCRSRGLARGLQRRRPRLLVPPQILHPLPRQARGLAGPVHGAGAGKERHRYRALRRCAVDPFRSGQAGQGHGAARACLRRRLHAPLLGDL